MSINMIVACDERNGIGKDGDMPWPRNKQDMMWFRDHTLGHVIVMGRKTWESIDSRPLPNRTNIVVSSEDWIEGSDWTLSGDMEQILAKVADMYPGLHVWVIGGEFIYGQAYRFCDKLFLTRIGGTYDCDRHLDPSIVDSFPTLEYQQNEEGISFEIRSRL